MLVIILVRGYLPHILLDSIYQRGFVIKSIDLWFPCLPTAACPPLDTRYDD